MKINKLELQNALAIVKPGLASQDVLEQTTSFAFMGGRVVTYNDELSISHPIKDLDFDGVVKADELYGLLSRLKKEEIDLTIDDQEMSIKCGRVKAGLAIEREIILPIKEEIGTLSKWRKIPNPQDFYKHLSFTLKACSHDMSQIKMTCVSILSNGRMVGSDGFRLAQCIAEEGYGFEKDVDSFLLPASLAVEVLKIDPVEIKVKGAWIHFRNEADTIISTRMVNDTYVPDGAIEEVLQMGKKTAIEFPKTIDAVLDRVGQFAKRDFTFDEIVYANIKKGKITLRADAAQTKSWIEETAKMETDAEIKFALTPSLFQDILKETRICNLAKDLTKAKFISKKSNWEYVIMLRK